MFDSASVTSESLIGMMLPLFKDKGPKACEKDNFSCKQVIGSHNFSQNTSFTSIIESIGLKTAGALFCHIKAETILHDESFEHSDDALIKHQNLMLQSLLYL